MWKLTVTLFLVLAGCAQPQKWYGGTESSFNRDRYECEQEAARSFPPQMVQHQTSPGVNVQPSQSVQTNCTRYGNQVNCTSTPQGVNASIYNRPPSYVTLDANAGSRGNSVRSCLFARGYRLQ